MVGWGAPWEEVRRLPDRRPEAGRILGMVLRLLLFAAAAALVAGALVAAVAQGPGAETDGPAAAAPRAATPERPARAAPGPPRIAPGQGTFRLLAAGGTRSGADAAGRAAATPPIRWRPSRALGLPQAGRLVDGVRLPREGEHFFTWDPVRKASPNRAWRRWGTDVLVRRTLRVAREHRAANADAPRVAIGDISRPQGGDFGHRWGSIGHVSHQNGLDVDVYYPRTDRRERAPRSARAVDRRLAQDLVDRFVAAGAEKVFVGPNVGLTGRPSVVQMLANHDDHVHVRFPPLRR
ncbi:MAG TPA: penicillin-insensitive murein endopeptidase [Gaiellaceae bacterium]|nr:penicillin-insensitive murein endopeptidase [Gaiellaceae bacterium]